MSESEKYARDAIEKELSRVQEKEWKIFSWASSLMIVMIGGILALTTETSFSYKDVLPWVMTSSVIVIAIYSILWVSQNLRLEKEISDKLNCYNKKLDINYLYDSSSKVKFGYTGSLALLAIAAIFCIWLDGLATHKADKNKEKHSNTNNCQEVFNK